MRLGGWESLDMVLRYTRSVKFEDRPETIHGIETGETEWGQTIDAIQLLVEGRA